MRRSILLVFLLSLLASLLSHSPSFAADLRLIQAFGRSSQALVLEEEEDDDPFSFWKAGLGLSQGDEKAKFHLDVLRYEKDYKTRLTDFQTTRVETEAWRRLNWMGDEFRGGILGQWRHRDFERFSLQGFREFRFGAYAEGWRDWGARTSASFYDYEGSRREARFAGRLNRALEWRGMDFKPFISGQYHDASSRKRFKGEAGSLAVWEPAHEHWERLSMRLEAGQRDTKLIEEREDDADYSFWEFDLRSRHPVVEGQVLRWTAGVKQKDDKGAAFGHRGNEFEAGYQFRFPYGRKERISLEPLIGFKRMNFTDSPNLSYEKATVGALASMLSRGDWRVAAEGRFAFYNHTVQDKHRQRATAKLAFEKELSDSAEAKLGGVLRNSTVSFEASLSLKL